MAIGAAQSAAVPSADDLEGDEPEKGDEKEGEDVKMKSDDTVAKPNGTS